MTRARGRVRTRSAGVLMGEPPGCRVRGTNEAATRVSPSQKNARRRAWQVCASHSVVEMRRHSRLCWDGSDVDHVAALTRMQIQ